MWIYLLLSLVAETIGDIALKTNHRIVSFLFYAMMLLAWFKVVEKAGQNIMIPGLIWLLGGEIVLVLVGVFLFHEPISTKQMVGIGLGMVAVGMMA